MTDQYDIVDIGVNPAQRSFHGDRKAVTQRAFDAGVRTLAARTRSFGLVPWSFCKPGVN